MKILYMGRIIEVSLETPVIEVPGVLRRLWEEGVKTWGRVDAIFDGEHLKPVR